MISIGFDEIVMGLPQQENKLVTKLEHRSVLTSESYQSTGFSCSQQLDNVKEEKHVEIVKNVRKNDKRKKSSTLF